MKNRVTAHREQVQKPRLVALGVALAALTMLADSVSRAKSYRPPRIPVTVSATTRYHVPVGNSPVNGPSTALVTIVSFWDFQCPFCSRAMDTMTKLLKLYPKDVRLVFKHNPLRFHRYAFKAAEAAVEAHKQKKFWKYQALLWPHARNLTQATLEQQAKLAKMNVKRLTRALNGGTHRNTVNSDIALARQLGATGTPSFFINGVNVRGARPLATFKAEVEREIKHAKAVLKSKRGLTRKKLYAEIIKGGLKSAPARRPYYRWRRPYYRRRPYHAYAMAKVYTQSSHIKASRKLTLDDAPQMGPKRAPIALVFFAGFKCYYADRILAAYQELAEEFPGMLRLVFKHHVLSSHRYGYLAAQAAVEAQKQGRFWEYARHLWANRYALDRAKLLLIAKNIGMDTKKLSQALTDERHALRVQRDFAEARGHVYQNYMCEAVVLPGGQTVGGYSAINSLRTYLLPIIREMNLMGHILPLP